MIRVAHATDIHWFRPPRIGELSPKRILGSANLYLRSRRHHFDPLVQSALMRDLLGVQPDALVISGDLTAQATDAEFTAAREALTPVLSAVPTVVLSGNHDVYTRGAQRADRLGAHFGEHCRRDGPLSRLSIPGLTVLGLDPTRPHPTASGVVPGDQLEALGHALAGAPCDDVILLALHYPVVDRAGALYDHWEHGLRNAAALVHVLEEAPRRPDAILHGHVHHGFRSDLHLSDDMIPTYNPGSSGYAWMPDKDRAACFNVYVIEHGDLIDVERYRFDDGAFRPEPGGAYATGR